MRRFTKKQKQEILKKVAKYNGFVNDCNIAEVTNLLPYKFSIDQINGWYENSMVKGEYIKDYFIQIEDYKELLIVSFYANEGEWKVFESLIRFSIM